MTTAKDGLFIAVNYTGTLTSGEVFDTSEGRAPLEFKMGAGMMISGFEAAVAGMAIDEEKTFTLAPEEAYGERDDSLSRDFPRAEVPEGFDPQVGQQVALAAENGQQIPATVTHTDDEKITIDLNHPLAGETLTFAIKVMSISETPTQAMAECGGGCACTDDDKDRCGC